MGAEPFDVQNTDWRFHLLFLYSQNNVKMYISYQILKLIYRQTENICYKMKYVFINFDDAKVKMTSWEMWES